MIYTSEELFPVSAISSHCWTWALMNILNYFWGTTFWLKDTYDVEVLARLWHFDWNERPSEIDIYYFLCQMNFKVEEFINSDKWDFELFVKDNKSHQEKFWYIPHELVNIDSSINIAKKLLNHENYFLNEDKNLNIENIIKEKSDWKHMFMFWLDYNKLYWIEDWKVEWHIMASIWFEKWNEKISLIETSPVWKIVYKTYEELSEAIKNIWSPICVTVISLNEE